MPDQSTAEVELPKGQLKEISISDLKPEHLQQVLEGWQLEKPWENIWNFSYTTKEGKTKRLSVDKGAKRIQYSPDYSEGNKSPVIDFDRIARVQISPDPSYEIYFWGENPNELYKIEYKGQGHSVRGESISVKV